MPPQQEPSARLSDEIYRQYLQTIVTRFDSGHYTCTDALLQDLLLLERSLRQQRGQFVAAGALRQLMQKLRLFGLHLLPLEVREDAQRHAATVDELFRYYGVTEEYLSLSETDKQRLLERELTSRRPFSRRTRSSRQWPIRSLPPGA
jgi:phosphoenolpyruvate carboxylase